jgi:hypothetical protein
MMREEEVLRSQLTSVEDKYQRSLVVLDDGERQMEQMEVDYKNLQEADRLLDKNFKKEFPGLGFHQLDSLYKLFKKRPKVSFFCLPVSIY